MDHLNILSLGDRIKSELDMYYLLGHVLVKQIQTNLNKIGKKYRCEFNAPPEGKTFSHSIQICIGDKKGKQLLISLSSGEMDCSFYVTDKFHKLPKTPKNKLMKILAELVLDFGRCHMGDRTEFDSEQARYLLKNYRK